MMQLVFTKGDGKTDRLEVRRSDGTVEIIDCPKQGIIPHDMVHYAVEHILHVRGFVTRVAAGEAAEFRMQAEEQSDGVERLVEVFQGDGWSGGTTPPEEMIDLYRITCEARHCAMIPVTADDMMAVRSEIATLTARWASIAVGGSMTLVLDGD